MLVSDLLATETVRKLRVSDVDRLIEADAFGDERVELLDGVLVTMSPHGAAHLWVTQWLAQQLIEQLASAYRVVQHSSFEIGRHFLPEPDVVVVPTPRRIARPTSALLVAEIAETSLLRDRRKASLYAAARIPEYWIVNLAEHTVEVRSRPRAGKYRSLAVLDATDRLRPASLPGVTIAVADVLAAGVAPRRRPRRRR